MENITLKHQVRLVLHTQDHQISRKRQIVVITTQIILAQNPYNYNRGGNRSRRPFSRYRLRNVQKFTNSVLDQEQMAETTSITEHTETQIVSKDQLLEQQFNDLFLELKIHQMIILTDRKNVMLSLKNTPFLHCAKIKLGYYQHIHNRHLILKEEFPHHHLKLTFFIDSGAILNALNNETWNDIREFYKLQLRHQHLISQQQNSKLHSKATVKLTLYPDVIENRTSRNIIFTLNFHVSNTKSAF